MKIRVVPQIYYREHIWQESSCSVYDVPEAEFWIKNNFISIRHSAEKNPHCAIPVDGPNILRLQFDDATEDPEGGLILFDTEMAKQIKTFVDGIDQTKELFVNCAAGISRSGAVGDVLNDYFNRYLGFNAEDDYYFRQYNRHILPNPLVRRVLHEVFFAEENNEGLSAQ